MPSQTVAPEYEKLFPHVETGGSHHSRHRIARAPGRMGLRYLRIAAPDEKLGPVPFVIGVCGHGKLDPAQEAVLEKRVARVFAEARAECRFTPLLLLTALAEGADQLAARVALREKVPLAVVLPAEQETYERAFETPRALETFRSLLANAAAVHHAWGDQHPGSTPHGRAGAFIVANCDLLVALCDGDEGNSDGTADVIRWQREGLPPAYTRNRSPLEAAGSGPVRHIHASRAAASPSAEAVETAEAVEVVEVVETTETVEEADEWLLEPGSLDSVEVPAGYEPGGPDVHGEIRQSRYLGKVDWPIREQIHGFNRDAVELRERLARGKSDAARDLMPAPPPAGQAPVTLDVLAECDALASYFGKERKRAIKTTFRWAGAAILLFTLFAHPAHAWLLILLGYLTCLSVAIWSAHRVRRLRLEEKHLDYRALAEGLRVQFYWELAGIREGVADHYLRNQRTELSWIPRAIRALCVRWELPGRDDGAPSAQALEAVKHAWVESEVGFFSSRIVSMNRWLGWLERASAISFRLAFAGAVILFAALLYPHPVEALTDHVEPGEWWPISFGWAIFALAFFAIAAGFMRAIVEKMGYVAEIRRYEWMQGLHDQVDAIVSDDPAHLRTVLVDLGRYALIENAEWLRIHRDRPLEVPVG
jgi:hypothetical protein